MSVVKVPAGSNMVAASLVGCAVTTGVGAARNTADIRPGDTVAVIGCGGVGLNVVQGAKLAGAGQIIAIDMVDLKLDLARKLGATDVVNAAKDDVVEAVKKLTGGNGADVAFDVTGFPTAVTQMYEMTRRGGEMVLIGVGQPESALATRPIQTTSKTLKGCCFGDAKVDEFFPLLLQEYVDGLLDIDTLISKQISLDEINAGFEDMEGGRVARSVIVYD
jgi:Zn-dependent alcohol dehydrogenase